MSNNRKHIASIHRKREVTDHGLPPITKGQLMRRQNHLTYLKGQPITVEAMTAQSMTQVAPTPTSKLLVLSSVKLKPGRDRP